MPVDAEHDHRRKKLTTTRRDEPEWPERRPSGPPHSGWVQSYGASNPAIASLFHSWRPAGRVAELGSLDLMTRHVTLQALVVAAFLSLFTGCVSQPVCVLKATPPKPEELAGVWIGFEQDELDFVRLDLRPDFTGYSARVSPADTSLHEYGVEAYRITQWTLEDWKLIINLTPITTNAETIYLRGDYSGFSFDLEMGGTTNQWKRKLVLYRESRIDGANKKTRDKIRELEKR